MSRSSLIWVCTVCPGISIRKFRIITVNDFCLIYIHLENYCPLHYVMTFGDTVWIPTQLVNVCFHLSCKEPYRAKENPIKERIKKQRVSNKQKWLKMDKNMNTSRFGFNINRVLTELAMSQKVCSSTPSRLKVCPHHFAWWQTALIDVFFPKCLSQDSFYSATCEFIRINMVPFAMVQDEIRPRLRGGGSSYILIVYYCFGIYG